MRMATLGVVSAAANRTSVFGSQKLVKVNQEPVRAFQDSSRCFQFCNVELILARRNKLKT